MTTVTSFCELITSCYASVTCPAIENHTTLQSILLCYTLNTHLYLRQYKKTLKQALCLSQKTSLDVSLFVSEEARTERGGENEQISGRSMTGTGVCFFSVCSFLSFSPAGSDLICLSVLILHLRINAESNGQSVGIAPHLPLSLLSIRRKGPPRSIINLFCSNARCCFWQIIGLSLLLKSWNFKMLLKHILFIWIGVWNQNILLKYQRNTINNKK